MACRFVLLGTLGVSLMLPPLAVATLKGVDVNGKFEGLGPVPAVAIVNGLPTKLGTKALSLPASVASVPASSAVQTAARWLMFLCLCVSLTSALYTMVRSFAWQDGSTKWAPMAALSGSFAWHDSSTKWAPMAISSSDTAEAWNMGLDSLAEVGSSVAHVLSLAAGVALRIASSLRDSSGSSDSSMAEAASSQSTYATWLTGACSSARPATDVEVELLGIQTKDPEEALDDALGSFLAAKLLKPGPGRVPMMTA